MRSVALAGVMMFALAGPALAWGEDGHSIVAEIAQPRLSEPAARLVQNLLKGRSLASIASWADDYRASHPETAKWHFVDIPLDVATYDAARDCKPGDCVIAELVRLQKDLRCATGDAQTEALKFTVHFLGDIHQPLHAVQEQQGGNAVQVDVFMRGLATCPTCPTCTAVHMPVNFHKAWDETLIQRTAWSWGAYVDRLENDWLQSSQEAKTEDPATNHTPIDEKTLISWAEETHRAAQKVWYWRPADDVLDDRYLRDVLPIMDRQLGIAGLRLARFLNQAASQACSAQ